MTLLLCSSIHCTISVGGGDSTLATGREPAGAVACPAAPRTVMPSARRKPANDAAASAAGLADLVPLDASLSAGAPVRVTRPWSASSGVITDTLPVVT